MSRRNFLEVDPLLPQSEPSPEIQSHSPRNQGGYEISYSNTPHYTDETIMTYNNNNNNSNNSSEISNNYLDANDDEDRDPRRPMQRLAVSPSRFPADAASATRSSAFSTIATFVIFAVFFGVAFYAFGQRGDAPKQPGLIPSPDHPPPPGPIDERVKKILTETPLFDGHNDLADQIRAKYHNRIHDAEFRDDWENGGMSGDLDLPRLRKGMVGGSFWSAFVFCSDNASEDFSDAEYARGVSKTLQQIDMLKRLQKQYDGTFSQAGSDLGDMLARFHATGALISPLSIEGLHQVPQSAAMSTLRLYYEAGVRAATLTWNCHNKFADAAMVYSNGTLTVSGPHRGGLTDAGKEVVREMNRLGMLVDVSHTSYWTQKAVMTQGTSRAPVIFSHSSVYEICPHPRNVKDDVLDLVKETESIVMINFSPPFISCVPNPDGGPLPKPYQPNSTIDQVVRHIMYVGEKIGYDYVGFGSDFDGMGPVAPEGLDGVDKYPSLVAKLLEAGVSDEDASKIVGKNLLRVWHAVEDVARDMRREGVREGEDHVGNYFDMVTEDL